MRYLRVVANWLFLVGMFPMVYVYFIAVAFCKAGKTLFEETKEDHLYLYEMFFDRNFIKKRYYWLVAGELWPMQQPNKEQKKKMREYGNGGKI